MCGTVGVPNPVVGIEGFAFVVMHFTIECGEIASVFAQANWAFEGSVIGCIEDCLLVFCSAFDKDCTQCFVPFLASVLDDFGNIECVGLFSAKVLLCLFLTDERNTVAEAYFLCAGGEAKGCASTGFFGNLLVGNLTVVKQTYLFRFYIELARQIDTHVSAQTLTAGCCSAVDLHFAILSIEKYGCRL